MAIENKTWHLMNSGSLTHKLYDTIFFNKIKAKLGGNLKVALTGSAPIGEKVKKKKKISLGCPVIEAYG